MKKGNMELGKRIITWTMAAVMTVTSVGGSFGTMTVYAEEKPAVVTEVPDMVASDVRDAADNAADAATAAQAAADAATDAVEAIDNIDISGAQADIAEAEKNMAAATEKAGVAFKDAEDAVVDAKEDKESADAKLKEAEAIVADSEKAVDEAEKKVLEAATAVRTFSYELTDGKDGKSGVKAAIDAQTELAVAARDLAKAELEAALVIDTNVVTPEVEAKVDAVNVAADKAAQAAADAQKIMDDAQAALDAEKAEYEKVKAEALAMEADFAAQLAAKQAEIDALNKLLEEAEEQYSNAYLAATNAAQVAAEANALVAAANDKIQTENTTAQNANTDAYDAAVDAKLAEKSAVENADAVANMYVTPAQEVVDKAQADADAKTKAYNAAVEQAEKDKLAAQKAYDDAVKAAAEAKAAAEKTAADAKAASLQAIEDNAAVYEKNIADAKEKYNSEKHDEYWFFGRHCYSDCDKCAAKDAWDAAEDAKQNDINKVNAAYDAAVDAAQKAYTDAEATAATAKTNAETAATNSIAPAQKAMNDALLVVAEKQQPLEEEKAIRDAILSVMTDDVDANEEIIKAVSDELAGEGEDYLEYMNDLNAYVWATEERNGSWMWEGSWWTGEALKVAIEDKYGDGFFEDLLNIISISKVKNELTDSKEAAEQLVKELQEKEAILQSKQDAIVAAKAAVEAATAMDTVAQKAAEIATAATAAQNAADDLANAKADVEAKKAAVEELKAKLAAARQGMNDIKATADKLETAKLDLTKAENRVKNAQDKLNQANNNLKETKAAAAAAQSYADWANALVTAQVTRTDVQVDKDTKESLTFNKENFDLTDAQVMSQSAAYFKLLNTDIEVPYSIYRAYVERMYDLYNYTDVQSGKKGVGQGIAAGDSDDNTMPVVYWVVGEDGTLTGEYYESEEGMPSGTYFVGYAFKFQYNDNKNKYHLDGLMYEYEAPPVVEPVEPEVVPPTDGDEGDTSGGGRSSRSSRSSSDEGAVLGAKREQEGLVPEDGQVLGAVRAPKTSDASKAILWMLVMGGSALGAAAVLAQKKKEEA